MADPVAAEIMQSVLTLCRAEPWMPPLVILDRVMPAHCGTSLDFGAGYEWDSPFFAVLARAFRDGMDPMLSAKLERFDADFMYAGGGEAIEAFYCAVPTYFEERYRLNGAEPLPPPRECRDIFIRAFMACQPALLGVDVAQLALQFFPDSTRPQFFPDGWARTVHSQMLSRSPPL